MLQVFHIVCAHCFFSIKVSKISVLSAASHGSAVAKPMRSALNETFDADAPVTCGNGQTGGTQPYCSPSSSPAGFKLHSPLNGRTIPPDVMTAGDDDVPYDAL